MADDRANNSKKQLKVINYAGRDFNSIRNNLIDYVKRYYPDSFKDFNSAGFGSLVLDTVAYVGDVLSFYADYQLNETFLDTANEYDNVVKIARQLGYKYADSFSSVGTAQFFISVPASTAGALQISLGSVSFNKSELLDGYEDQILIISITFSVPSIGMDQEIVEIGSAVQTL